MNYVVYSPGRTGSLLIAKELARLNHVHILFHIQPDENVKCNSSIIHSHNMTISIENKHTYTAVVSKRNNEFARAISEITTIRTGKYHQNYDVNVVSPFSVSRVEFIKTILKSREFYSQIDLTGYANVVEIYFEKMIEDPYFLHQQLGIEDNSKMEYLTPPSPYGTSLIKNIEELGKLYNELFRRTV